MEAAAYEAVSQCDRQGRKAVKTTKDNISIARERMERHKAASRKERRKKQNRKLAAVLPLRPKPSRLLALPIPANRPSEPAVRSPRLSKPQTRAEKESSKLPDAPAMRW